jgi:vitamin B12 transporter
MQRLLLFLLLYSSCAFAQRDTTRWLKEVRVSGKSLSEVNATVRHDTLASTPAMALSAGNLAARLERESNVFIRNYGAGNLSSISMRGTGAAQTAVLWNGLQVQSPMLGLYDLTLIPSFLIGSTDIHYGGCSASTGSAAMGGAILVSSDAKKLSGVSSSLFTGIGDFGHLQSGVEFNIGKDKFFSTSKYYSQRSKNDFRYINVEGQMQQQTNSAYDQLGLAQDFKFIGKLGELNIHGWYLENSRKIPPHMLTTSSKQEQEDQSIRISADWSFKKNAFSWFIRSGWSKEKIAYKDPAALLDEKSRAYIFQPEAQMIYTINPYLKLTTVAGIVLNEANVEYYGNTKSTTQSNLSTALNYSKVKSDLQVIVRGGTFNGDALPIIPSLAYFYHNRSWGFRIEAARIYRNPTLNDLYWQPGGNTSLIPESGFSGSSSIEKVFNHQKFFIKATGGAFYNNIQNLLTWIPDASGLYYATNLNRTESKGLEGSLLARSCFKKLNFKFTINGQYNLAVLKESNAAMEQGINKQLIYTPRIMMKGQMEFIYESFSLSYFHNYTGYRYTTQDHSYFLEPFATGECMLSYNRSFRKTNVMIFGTIKNCWNADYQVIAWRAMPGRYWESGLLLTFGK